MFANRFTVVLDACVLAPAANRDLILCLAEAKFFRPRWSDEILSETHQAAMAILERRGLEKAKAEQRAADLIRKMRQIFPEAYVDNGYKVFEPSLFLPDEKDRHVLAAAIHCRASTIVTDNLRDFPASQLAMHGIEAKSADDFIADEIDLDIYRAAGVVKKMRARLKRPEMSASDLLLKMEARGLTETSRMLRPFEELI
ncbi:MAG: PIN domain-containing protein [Henriciella sp.]|jgi:predicted nucleic acid-binding protein|uniref:PIN domain-containing protein n=1 Tax=Henriciella sp. TaxID=1968823 RepID=UPI000C104A15|nr:PIN domain-containing protein [Henriciella sp.]MAN75021.1 PIN domain-containing protein [Henriciella sp.]MBF33782.1 PIN domain-containing protein [Hyphomonadaceae bacterium]MBK76815.1 PIN domain-containing protein [Henriciella sp.]PHR76426.1 MAG: PIN domain-containing protein [Henriciella sp.]|tara:strand:+ start:89 stop:685 length:597 start_codon:yes stop_codon:yes gene_type:complete